MGPRPFQVAARIQLLLLVGLAAVFLVELGALVLAGIFLAALRRELAT